MFDALFVLIGLAAFALTVLYAVACEQMWGAFDDFRLCAGRARDACDHRLSGLRPDQARAVL